MAGIVGVNDDDKEEPMSGHRNNGPCPGAEVVERDAPVVEVVKAFSDFCSIDDNQLTFSSGAELNVIRKTTAEWWWAELGGRFGYIPVNHVMSQSDLKYRESWQDEEYFENYSALKLQQEMLSDRPRTLAYKSAIEKNVGFLKGKGSPSPRMAELLQPGATELMQHQRKMRSKAAIYKLHADMIETFIDEDYIEPWALGLIKPPFWFKDHAFATKVVALRREHGKTIMKAGLDHLRVQEDSYNQSAYRCKLSLDADIRDDELSKDTDGDPETMINRVEATISGIVQREIDKEMVLIRSVQERACALANIEDMDILDPINGVKNYADLISKLQPNKMKSFGKGQPGGPGSSVGTSMAHQTMGLKKTTYNKSKNPGGRGNRGGRGIGRGRGILGVRGNRGDRGIVGGRGILGVRGNRGGRGIVGGRAILRGRGSRGNRGGRGNQGVRGHGNTRGRGSPSGRSIRGSQGRGTHKKRYSPY